MMTESSDDISDNLLLFRVRFFFFFNMSLRLLLPWQLKKKTAMVRHCVLHVRRFLFFNTQLRPLSCSLPPHVTVSPSAMAVPCRVLVFAASSSSTRRCVLSASPPP
ncbi:hypothetical protein AHAS_Ahas13G0416400 [Arachis hypogaea]